jgi:hypothetical protein
MAVAEIEDAVPVGHGISVPGILIVVEDVAFVKDVIIGV